MAMLPQVQCPPARCTALTEPPVEWRIPIAGIGRGPAGGPVRPGLLSSRGGQKHLWHRLLPADEHWAGSCAGAGTACSPPLPWAWTVRCSMPWRAAVFVGGAVIQWLRDELRLLQRVAGMRSTTPRRCRIPAGVYRGPGLHRPGGALLGYVRPGRHGGAHPGHDPGTHYPGGAGVHRLPELGSGPRPWSRTPACPWPSSRWTAAPAGDRFSDAVPGGYPGQAGPPPA